MQPPIYRKTAKGEPGSPISEHAHQKALFSWASLASRQRPELGMLVAIPNGGLRSKAVAAKLKAEGVKAGYPDMALNVPRGPYHGLFIELKSEKGRVSPLQSEWLTKLNAYGNLAVTAYGWIEAKQHLENYLDERFE